MKNIKPFAPPTLPIGYSAGRTSLCGSGHLFCMRICRKCGGPVNYTNRFVCYDCLYKRNRERHREKRDAIQKSISIPSLEGEIWVPVPDSSQYMVSNLGRIKRLPYNYVDKRGGIYIMPEKLLKQTLAIRGYYVVNGKLIWPERRGAVYVHRILAMAFIPNPENKPHVNHINGIKSDNSLGNLEWVSHSENMMHSRLKRPKSSKYPGVVYEKANRNWKACMSINGKSKHIGVFQTEEEAYEAYKQFCKEHNIQNKYA